MPRKRAKTDADETCKSDEDVGQAEKSNYSDDFLSTPAEEEPCISSDDEDVTSGTPDSTELKDRFEARKRKAPYEKHVRNRARQSRSKKATKDRPKKEQMQRARREKKQTRKEKEEERAEKEKKERRPRARREKKQKEKEW